MGGGHVVFYAIGHARGILQLFPVAAKWERGLNARRFAALFAPNVTDDCCAVELTLNSGVTPPVCIVGSVRGCGRKKVLSEKGLRGNIYIYLGRILHEEQLNEAMQWQIASDSSSTPRCYGTFLWV